METSEKQLAWEELSDLEKEGVAAAHREALKTSQAHLLRLMELGRPKVVIGYQGKRMKYCRIDPASVDVMKVILTNYL